MATVNFPSSPALNDEYTYGGFTYVYDGEKWTSKATTNTAFVKTTGDTMSGGLTIKPPSSGQLEFSGTADHSQVSFNRVDGTPAHIFRYVESGDSLVGLARNLDGSLLREWISHEYGTGKTRINDPCSTTAQGTEGISLTRKDYVDAATQYLDGVKINREGDTMTGWLYAPQLHMTEGQSGAAGAATRRDWIEANYRSFTEPNDLTFWGTRISGNAARGVVYRNDDDSVGGSFGMQWDSDLNGVATNFYIGDTDNYWNPASATNWFAVGPGGVISVDGGKRVFHQGFLPTALEVGAATEDRVNELEARITQLETLVATLTGGA